MNCSSLTLSGDGLNSVDHVRGVIVDPRAEKKCRRSTVVTETDALSCAGQVVVALGEGSASERRGRLHDMLFMPEEDERPACGQPRVTGTPPSPPTTPASHAAHAAAYDHHDRTTTDAAYDHHDRTTTDAAYDHHDRTTTDAAYDHHTTEPPPDAAYDHHDRTTTDADLGRGWNHHGVPGATGSL